VEYQLTDAGLSMKPMLKSISDWGMKYKTKSK
jgi:DNA-binding HxlR family transcriptional regulator